MAAYPTSKLFAWQKVVGEKRPATSAPEIKSATIAKRKTGQSHSLSACMSAALSGVAGKQNAPSLFRRQAEQEARWRQTKLDLNPRRGSRDQPSRCRPCRRNERGQGRQP